MCFPKLRPLPPDGSAVAGGGGRSVEMTRFPEALSKVTRWGYQSFHHGRRSRMCKGRRSRRSTPLAAAPKRLAGSRS